VATFREILPDTPLLPEPVLTLWGKLLEAAEYYSRNFRTTEAIVNGLLTHNAHSIRAVQAVLGEQGIKTRFGIYTHQLCLPVSLY
jgi:hypothetical protein